MRILLLLILIGTLCASCGVKEKHEYKSQKNYNKTINLT